MILILTISISIIAQTNTKVKANATPGIVYNAFSSAIAISRVEIKPKTKESIDLKSFFKLNNKKHNRVVSKDTLMSINKINAAPTIFGTVYDSKTFLTATSSLFIDKQDVSPLLDYPPYQIGTTGSLLVLGGIKWL